MCHLFELDCYHWKITTLNEWVTGRTTTYCCHLSLKKNDNRNKNKSVYTELCMKYQRTLTLDWSRKRNMSPQHSLRDKTHKNIRFKPDKNTHLSSRAPNSNHFRLVYTVTFARSVMICRAVYCTPRYIQRSRTLCVSTGTQTAHNAMRLMISTQTQLWLARLLPFSECVCVCVSVSLHKRLDALCWTIFYAKKFRRRKNKR